MKNSLLYLLFFLLLNLSAQAQAIRGVVRATGGEPLPGVTVLMKGTQEGTATDGSGRFVLPLTGQPQPTLIFYRIGYETKQVPYRGEPELLVILREGTASLEEVNVTAFREQDTEVSRLADVQGTLVVAGKKNEVIPVSSLNANLAEKTGRQVFSKVPGVFVYDMDGSGNQVNIATRGLDPHRSWEYNVRQNGVMLNSDIYGYPASHYSPPLESIERVELIRGTASLQYGAAFGGLINYVTKTGDTTKALSYEGLHAAGSFGLFSSYNAFSGKTGKFTYYTYFHKRVSEGYRQNSRSVAESQFASLTYRASPRLSLRGELGRSTYRYQIPGPLTDAMFRDDPRQATRGRNFFNPDIYVPSLTADLQISDKMKLSWVSSAVLGARNSVQFLGFADQPDRIDPLTLQYAPRQVDIDRFNSYTSELRLARDYRLGPLPGTLAAGVRYIHNNLHRRQLGRGTTGTGFDLSVSPPGFGRDVHLRTRNVALFAENLIRLSPRLSVSPGFRLESGVSRMEGTITYLAPEQVPAEIAHRFPLFGVNAQYRVDDRKTVYAGVSQAYRPVIFADVIPPTPLDRTDPSLRDASGHNAEIGFRGYAGTWLNYDVSLFQLGYHNRIGSLVLTEDGQPFVYKTNIGNSLTRGLELYAEATPLRTAAHKISFFTSTSYFDASYRRGSVVVNRENVDIGGNRLEGVPRWMSRNGLELRHRYFSATVQHSYVGQSYSDALNTGEPSANGARGLVPSYGVWDVNASLRAGRHYTFKLGVNNLTNERYFTKRPTMYPGPGIWPSDGRSVVGSVVLSF